MKLLRDAVFSLSLGCTLATAQPGTPTVKTTVAGQTVELTLCERVALDPKVKNDVMAVGPTNKFVAKGTVNNVFGVFHFDPPLNSTSKHTVKVIAMKNGSFADDRDITFTTGGRTGAFSMTLPPGDYELQIVNKFNQDQLYFKNRIAVAADNTAPKIGKLMVCKEVDDNWKCVGESTTWKANEPFNLFVELPAPAGLTLTKWVIYKQNPDGTDAKFIDENVQNIGEARFKKWATTEGFRLPPGTYSLYSTSAAGGEQQEHRGNLKGYFAKTTLTIR